MIGHMISNSTVGPKTLSISLMRLFLDFHPMTYVRDLHTLISVLAALGSTKKPPGHPTTYDASTTEKTPNGLIFKLLFVQNAACHFHSGRFGWLCDICQKLEIYREITRV